MASALVTSAPRARALTLLPSADVRKWLRQQSAATRSWLDAAGFVGKAGDLQLLPSASGRGSVGAVMVFIRSTRSNRDGRRFCTPRMVSAEPAAECSASWSANSRQPRGSLFWNCTRAGAMA